MKQYMIFISQVGVESRATQSVRVPVQNLQKYDPHINVNQLQVMRQYEYKSIFLIHLTYWFTPFTLTPILIYIIV